MRYSKLAALTACIGLSRSAPTPSAPAWPTQTYESEPSFHPPQLQVTRAGTPAPGYLFFAPAGAAPQKAPLITTDDGALVWQGAVNNSAFNFGTQTYRGQPVLVYWNGTVYPEPLGRGYGAISILDQTYTEIASVQLPGNFVTSNGTTFATNVDLHEIYITNRDTVLVTANNVTQADLTSVGGSKDGWIVDGLVYEIDIRTNRVLFRWSAFEHVDQIPLSASVYPVGTEGFTGETPNLAWGYFHINAVAPLNDGYIISSRYTCSIIAINRRGRVLWRLSGRNGADFRQGPGTSFCFQHDIRPVYSNPRTYQVGDSFEASLHDNANAPLDNGTTPSSGLVLRIDVAKKHVRLVQRYRNPARPIYAIAQGSAQLLPGGHVFVGHGFTPVFEEFAADGTPVGTYQFAPVTAARGSLSYRAFRQPWIGCPVQSPALTVAKKSNGKVTLHMSWNGATEYDHWIIRAAGHDGAMHTLKTVPKTGFETNVTIPATKKVQVEAIALAKTCRCDNSHSYSRSSIVDTS